MIQNKSSDSELVSGYQNGNEKAFEVLLHRHKSRVYTAIYLIVKDRYVAEDLLQETFIKAINTIRGGRYNEEGKFLPWVMRIAHNLVIDGFRKDKKMRFLSETRSATEDYSIFSRLSSDELNILEVTCKDELELQVVHFMEKLPKLQRDIVYMRLFQDLSFKEIAEMEDISINTALGRMRYALINLRKMIDKYEVVVDL